MLIVVLRACDKEWTKSVLEDLCSQNPSNILKYVHSMLYYINSIIPQGSADGFSPESPEYLHIDFAKNAYYATNEKNYLVQMMKWLDYQDPAFYFSVYFQQTVKGYLLEVEGISEVKEGGDEDVDDEENLNDPDVSGKQVVFLEYTIAKAPAQHNVPLVNLMDQHGTNDIISAYHMSPTLSSHFMTCLVSVL